MVSTLTGKSMAIARLAVPLAVQGSALIIANAQGEMNAIAHTLPFDDPKKTKRTVVG
jgi:aminomethyltransferase